MLSGYNGMIRGLCAETFTDSRPKRTRNTAGIPRPWKEKLHICVDDWDTVNVEIYAQSAFSVDDTE